MSRLAFALLLIVCACRKPASNPGSELANQRLHDHVVNKQRKVFVEPLGEDLIWSDAAIIERAREFPPPVKQLHGKASKQADANMAETALSAFLQDADRRKAEWHPGKLERKDTTDFGCQVSDGEVKADVNCIYANYFEARYPGAKLVMKGKLDPVLLFDGELVRGALMPVKF